MSFCDETRWIFNISFLFFPPPFLVFNYRTTNIVYMCVCVHAYKHTKRIHAYVCSTRENYCFSLLTRNQNPPINTNVYVSRQIKWPVNCC